MARLAAEAERQVLELTQHYFRKDRGEAARRLADAIEAALTKVDAPATRWRAAPAPYPELANEGFRWIKEHRYWFAYTFGDDRVGTIHHVLFEAADIPNRVRARPGEG